MTLDQCKAYAQRQADSQGNALVILNLNPFTPLFVVATKPRDLVCIVRPQVEAAK